MDGPRLRLCAALLVALATLSACRSGRNYPDPAGPRFSGEASSGVAAARGADTLRVASFNIEYALRVDSAIALILSEPGLRQADVLLLQEMDEEGTRRVAEALGMRYVYYPALLNFRTRRHFGNAVLSRWPFVDDGKLVLPHLGAVVRTQRIATAATLRVGDRLVRVYSTHLGTMVNGTPATRRAQLRAVLADAARYDRVVIGGDLNSHGVGGIAREMGYAWPTERGPRTTRFGRWDHIFFRGFSGADPALAGTVADVRGTSDHRPVWAVAVLD